MRLTDKVLVVTGGARGIGRGVALRAAAEGAAVVIGDLLDSTETVEQIVGAGGQAHGVAMDVRSADDWQRLVDEALRRHGRIDLLGNVAGIVNQLGPDTIVELTEEGWEEVVGTDLKGVWLGMRAVIPHMIDNGGGRIVNISSLAALRGLPNLAAYSAAKGGVAALTRQAAVEYAPRNVLVNAIAPGTVDTPILGDCTPEDVEAFKAAHAIKRLGRPADIAAIAVTFFAPDDGSWLTGQVMPVDGGWHVT